MTTVSAPSDVSKDILVATVGRPHGVKGLVHLFAATDDPASVEDIGALHDEKGRVWRAEWQGHGIARLFDASGRPVTDRDEASRLVNLKLYVGRDCLPDTDEDEFYHADLIGLRAETREGTVLGTVAVIHDYGAGVSLEITAAGQDGKGQDLIVPFTHACVPEILFDQGRIIVEPPHEVEVEGDLSGKADVAVRS
ncbi:MULTISPECIES: ribosome maturation factor RimM [Asaia]|uniref:Ribosome maturation factor RimM n=1 Tax=Asaia bogorensis NBRC 16594 TaxID=1231624 RepID=A0AAN4R4K4_9PROT|nr:MULTISPECIES: ribosome maturation factor RimM [Asaia]MDR6181590.1 16S rRNA processing protein RimM [Asaia bogorensis NBRC 16594]NIE79626.1 16S rRNA processing protein RimM [Asaia sp. As-1742]BAT19261.1 ribosomal RNA 16S processing protein RimM [Asaia bogorensis NBRC 16594]GBQ82403.1 ribosomal RNA small subunit 16S rRNA processing protein RimM [Asaia bogorensis NBRC 16594]GEL54245.1 ribosome maturation factor RimM [Asaia bogorensis NBRC 16594]